VARRQGAVDDGWQCPTCGRRFRQRTREHSCVVTTLAAHLARASADVKDTMSVLQDALTAIGPHATVPVKTMILLRATANFGGLVVRRDCVHLEFVLPRALAHARIYKREPLGPRRYTHRVRLTSPADVDGQLVEWLRESYQSVAGSFRPRSSSRRAEGRS
jgi:hypothetical protein